MSLTGQVLLGLGGLLAWLAVRAVKVAVPVAVAAYWAGYVWLSGRTWRHGVRRRLVRREVRAVGNWLAPLAVVGLVWQPLATAVVLAVAGGSLVAASLVVRHRSGQHQLDRGPIRVRAEVGTPRRITSHRGEVNRHG